jgi:anion-transporting  ArsA/GET3 family ATPase
MRSVFDVSEIGFVPRPVGHGVHAMSIDLDLAIVEYLATHLPSRRLAKAIAGNRVIERLFAAMPAVGEIATLNTLHRRLAETDGDRPRWDPVIVDLDATGHALMFLELRSVVGGLMGAGPMRRLVDDMAEHIADPQRCRLHLVTLPSELPVTETLQLYERLTAARSVTLGAIFVNRVPELALRPGDVAGLDALEAEAEGDAELAADVRFARARIDEVAQAAASVQRLREVVGLPLVELPELSVARLGAPQLHDLARRCREGQP